MDLYACAEGRREEAVSTEAGAARGERDRMEGAGPTDGPLSNVERTRQEDDSGLHGYSPRTGRLHMGFCQGGARNLI